MSEQQPALSVSTALSMAQDAVDGLGSLWLEGEVFEYRGPYRGSGHYYFKLRDQDAQLDVKIWAGTARRALKCELEEGRRIRVHGCFDIWNKRGSLSFVIDQVEDVGGGDLARRFEELKQKLRDEGLFEPERKLPVPQRPTTLALLCAHPSAASADFLQTMKEGAAPCRIWLAPCRVQGEGAAGELVIALAQAVAAKPEVIVLSRGGGSLEDLWAFNDESLVRAIADCPIPVVNAVGHESDFTLCDFVADERCKTPTAAAWRMCEGWNEARRLSGRLGEDLRVAMEDVLDGRQRDLRDLSRSLQEQRPERRLERLRNRISHAQQALFHALDRRLSGLRPRLEGLQPRLAAASPSALLERGYALIEMPGREGFLRNAEHAPIGAKLHIRLARGGLDATVDASHIPDNQAPRTGKTEPDRGQ